MGEGQTVGGMAKVFEWDSLGRNERKSCVGGILHFYEWDRGGSPAGRCTYMLADITEQTGYWGIVVRGRDSREASAGENPVTYFLET